MISPHHGNIDNRNQKSMHPLSPNVKRKNVDFTVHTPMPTHNGEYGRKEGSGAAMGHGSNNAVSPNGHYYNQKLM